MKILFVISSLGQGGAERVLSTLANRWCAGRDVAVVTIKGRESDFFPLDPRIRRFALDLKRSRWWMPIPHLRILLGIRRLVLEEKPDYVVSFVVKANLFTLAACLGTGARVVACEHSVIECEDVDPRQRLFRGLLYGKAHRIGVLLESVREEFRSAYPRIDPGKIVVIPNAISLEGRTEADFRPFAEQFERRREDIDIVLGMGRLVPLKGFDSLISAFAIARARNPRLRLVIAGDGPESDKLREAAKAIGAERSVLLLGSTRSPAAALKQADVFAMTSRFEGFPMVLVEALLAGLPVAAYDAAGVRDIIEDEASGLLVGQGNVEALAKAIQRLLDDRGLRDRLASGAKRVIERYTPEAIDGIWFEKVLTP